MVDSNIGGIILCSSIFGGLFIFTVIRCYINEKRHRRLYLEGCRRREEICRQQQLTIRQYNINALESQINQVKINEEALTLPQ